MPTSTTRNSKPVLRRIAPVVLLSAALIVALVLSFSISLNKARLQRQLNVDAMLVALQIARQTGEMNALMTSLVSMHQVSSNNRVDMLVQFAGQLQTRNPLVMAVGRYRSLSQEQRSDFEEQMREQGLYDYHVEDLGSDGSRVPSPQRSRIFPVSSIDPAQPALMNLLGIDLAADPVLARELNDMTWNNRASLYRIPGGWPAAGKLMLFRPVYRGMYAPRLAFERMRQSDGGYWAIIDPQQLIAPHAQILSSYGASLDVQSAAGAYRVLEQTPDTGHEGLLASLLEPLTAQRFFELGNARLRLTLSTDQHMLPAYIYGALAAVAAALASLAIGAALYVQRARSKNAARASRAALEHQANHDALTGCTNRYYFEKQLEQLISGKRKGDTRHALLYMDLDQFKVVNDTAGHAAGDRLLVELTQQLRQNLREGDTLSRLGGDEFAILIDDVDMTQAEDVANKIHELFQTLVFTDAGRAFPVRACLGLVHLDAAGDSVADLLAAADLACFAAKDLGRNTVFVYRANDETITHRSSELNWLPRLREALDQNLFRLHAQPVCSVDDLSITRFEFLLRLKDQEGGEANPVRVIEAAERFGLMREIDRWVIATAFSTIASLDEQHSHMRFAINLSGQSATDASVLDFITEQFRTHALDPRRITFEITETAAIAHFATAVALGNGVRALGCTLALDDFGSGLSSFGYLKKLPVDVLKIDGQFIRDITNDIVDRAMVKAIQDVARSMHLLTVAEFVEDGETIAVLKDIGIDLAQGYFIGKPMPTEDALAHAIEHNATVSGTRKAA